MQTTVAPCAAKRRTSAWTLVTNGQVASTTRSPRDSACRRTAGDTPCAENSSSEPRGASSAERTKTMPSDVSRDSATYVCPGANGRRAFQDAAEAFQSFFPAEGA